MHWSNVSKPSSSPVKTFSAPICGRFIDLSRRCCIERFRSSVVAGNLPISGNINLEYSVLGVFSSLQQALRSFVERFVTVRFKGAFHPVIDKWTVATSLPLAIGRFLLLRGQYSLGGVATHGIARYACRSACVTRSRGPQSRCVAVQPGVRARPAKPWAGCVLRAILRGTDDGAGGGSGSSEGFTKRVCGRVRRRCGERAFRNEGMQRERRV